MIGKIKWACHVSNGLIVHTPRYSFKMKGPKHYLVFSDRYGGPSHWRLPLPFGWALYVRRRPD